jgi:hypothetical protein
MGLTDADRKQLEIQVWGWEEAERARQRDASTGEEVNGNVLESDALASCR